MLIAMCHCLECQRRTGSAFGIQAQFASNQVQVSGRHSDFTRVSDEGGELAFHFCPDCGATVFNTTTNEGEVWIPVGGFADPSFPPPTVSIFESRRHPWAGLPDSIEHHED
jgi:hypothetical protein